MESRVTPARLDREHTSCREGTPWPRLWPADLRRLDARATDARRGPDRRGPSLGRAGRARGLKRLPSLIRTTSTFWLEALSGGGAIARAVWMATHVGAFRERPAVALLERWSPIGVWAALIGAIGVVQLWVLSTNRDPLRLVAALASLAVVGAIFTAYLVTSGGPEPVLYGILIAMQLIIAARATPLAWWRRGG